MFNKTPCAVAIGTALMVIFSADVMAADSAELQKIHNEIQQLKENYEARIQSLETRLKDAEAFAAKADDKASQVASAPVSGPPSGANSFNPAISLVLSGTYSNLSQDPANYRITGYVPSGDIGPGKRGFSLAESELGVYANIDPDFYGGLNFAMHPDNTASVEEAFVQTIGLKRGLTFKAGRYFSGIGYLNEQHAHVWDFVDNPLAYQAFLGTQLGEDGLQVKWLAPTDTYLELGAEIGRGRSFPGSDRDKNGAGASTIFAHAGGDVGINQSWRAGLSFLQTSPQNRQYSVIDAAGDTVKNAFTGNSGLWIADFVWKYAPNGDPAFSNFKLQGEYLRRREDGNLAYKVDTSPVISSYASAQSGWYVQGVYQFVPHWRVGLRTERLSSGGVDYGVNNANLLRPDYIPTKNSVMVDYSPSEFSRLRLQLAQDKSRQGAADNQVFLQYIMSLGAHGAHIY
ncbi:hypothetical protein [Sulfurirhabdus autotrophica]|uniref:Phosphate-selective porin O/P n=1 Tax=Sulfurirhabdus autotrophica TaxID=1706046 RepID=A0A4R3Y141_9PROT|nr:hypothetical protein [Sulfurirhabdus autotrophica]TCV85142.1 hypothetical protein EDC63_11031 [Sulfurirhabdus autotrophica]